MPGAWRQLYPVARCFFFLFAIVAIAAPAHAQIYTWRDSAGNLVLSNKPPVDNEGPVTTYAVAGAAKLRTTASDDDRAPRYHELIEAAAERHGVSAALVRAVIQAESAFNPRAVSPKGAMGLMQLMPATARELGVADPFHPEQNIHGGVAYLSRLLTRYDQNVELALAAYNAGPGAVERYGRIPPYRETQAYVRKIAGASVAPAAPPTPVIYKWIETRGGAAVVRYSNVAPKDTPYDVVGKR